MYKNADIKSLQNELVIGSKQQIFMQLVALDMLESNKIGVASYDSKQAHVLMSSFCQNDYLPVYGILQKSAKLRSIQFGHGNCFIDCSEYTSYGGLVSPSCAPNCYYIAIKHPSYERVVAVGISPRADCRVVNTPLAVDNHYSHAVFCTCTNNQACAMIITPCLQSTNTVDSLREWIAYNVVGRVFSAAMATFKASSETLKPHATLLTKLYELKWCVFYIYIYITLTILQEVQ